MINFYSILIALLGFSIQSFGFVLQKKGNAWMGWKGEKTKAYLYALLLWLAGVALNNISIVPIGMASKNLPPYIISGMSGWNITIMVLSAYFLLKEKLYLSDILFSALIIVSILVLNIIKEDAKTIDFNITLLIILTAVPFISIIPAFLKKISSKIKGIMFGLFSGISGGLSLVMLNLLVKTGGDSLLHYLINPYLYLFLLTGFSSFIAVQLAYKHGDIILIGPLQTSSSIIYPVICSLFIFGYSINIIQVICMIIIIISCIVILRRH